jgi:hypothetical protein
MLFFIALQYVETKQREYIANEPLFPAGHALAGGKRT